jgi:uncharacterized surface protein with fasciclin (FAS1) repeats
MQDKILRPALIFLCCLAACTQKTNTKIVGADRESKESIVAASQMDPTKTIPENISTDTSYTNLSEAFTLTGFMETLRQPGPFTVFAPTNSAFRKLPSGMFEGLMNNRRSDLANILSYHIVAGSVKTGDMKDGQKLKTLAGEDLIVTLRNDKVLINGVQVINPDIPARNGIVCVIDGVLFPQSQNAAAY